MAVFVQDSFNADDLVDITTRSGEIGASWTKHGSYGTGSFRVRNSGVYPYSDASIVYASGVPGTDEYDVEADYHYISNTVSLGIGARIQTNANTLYYVYHNQNEWVLVLCVNGVLTTLGVFSQTLTSNTTYKVKLEIRNATKRVFINNTQIISSTDNTITGTGRVGLRSPVASSDNVGKQVRYLLAKDLSPDITGTDTDTISETHTIQITPNTIAKDTDRLMYWEEIFSNAYPAFSDTDMLSVTESLEMVHGIVRDDTQTIADASPTFESKAYVYATTRPTLSAQETITINTAYPPVVNHLYESTIIDRSDVIHRLAHEHIQGPMQILYHHYGIFDTIQSAPLGQFVLGTSPIGEMPASFNELQDVMNFVVLDANELPRAVGTVFTDWELSTITATLSKSVGDYQPLLADFGITFPLEG